MPETIPLQDRRQRRNEWLNRIPLALSAWLLAGAAWPRLATREPREEILAGSELAAAVLLVVVIALSWRRRRRASTTLGWIDLAAAAMLFTEWADGLAHGHKWFTPVFLTAIVMLVVGLANRPLLRYRQRRRVLELDDNGIRFRLTRRRRFELPWSEVEAIERTGGILRIERRGGGEERIPLGRLDNGEEVARAVREEWARRRPDGTGVPPLEPESMG